jgi:hypothetical protein
LQPQYTTLRFSIISMLPVDSSIESLILLSVVKNLEKSYSSGVLKSMILKTF